MEYMLAIVATLCIFVVLVIDDRVERGEFKKEQVKWFIFCFSMIGIGSIMGGNVYSCLDTYIENYMGFILPV